METKIKKCPHCGYDRDFQVVEKIRRNLFFSFKTGEPMEASEDMAIGKDPKTAMCGNCYKRIKLEDVFGGNSE